MHHKANTAVTPNMDPMHISHSADSFKFGESASIGQRPQKSKAHISQLKCQDLPKMAKLKNFQISRNPQ